MTPKRSTHRDLCVLLSVMVLFVFVTAVPLVQAEGDTKRMKVFILSGQSNMVGWGNSLELPDDLRKGNDRVLMFEDGKWQPLKPFRPAMESQKKYGMTEYSFGPEIGFGVAMAKAWPDETIGIIKSATGGTGILAWSPTWTAEQADRSRDARKGDLYKVLVDKVKAARQARDIEIVGFLWKQGGKDMMNLSLATEYFDNFKTMIQGLRRDLDVADMPVIIGTPFRYTDLTEQQMERLEQYGGSRPGAKLILQAYADAEAKIPGVTLAVTGDLETHPQNVHYNTAGQLKQGEIFAKTYLDLAK